MARYQHLDIYKDTYRFVLELFRLKQKMAKNFKYDLGESSSKSALRVLRGIVLANGVKDKKKILQSVSLEIETLWVYLRLMLDLQAISRGQFQVLSELLYDVSTKNQQWLAWANKQLVNDKKQGGL